MELYDKNSTMELLGHQRPAALIGGSGIASEDFKKVLDTHRKNRSYTFNIAVDTFMLGYIYGKRAERQRHSIIK